MNLDALGSHQAASRSRKSHRTDRDDRSAPGVRPMLTTAAGDLNAGWSSAAPGRRRCRQPTPPAGHGRRGSASARSSARSSHAATSRRLARNGSCGSMCISRAAFAARYGADGGGAESTRRRTPSTVTSAGQHRGKVVVELRHCVESDRWARLGCPVPARIIGSAVNGASNDDGGRGRRFGRTGGTRVSGDEPQGCGGQSDLDPGGERSRTRPGLEGDVPHMGPNRRGWGVPGRLRPARRGG